MGFCDQAWQHTVKLQQAVLEHPFNEELAEGTLSPDRFKFYLAQDTRYLVGFGRALSVAAARAPEPEDLSFFAGAAREAVLVERALHEEYFTRFGLFWDSAYQLEPWPTARFRP